MRDHRPAWLMELIEQVVDCFSPFSDLARAGCECQCDDGLWEARLFLGCVEVVGGREDGAWEATGFEFNAAPLCQLFRPLEEFYWNVVPNSAGGVHSFLQLGGHFGGFPVRVKVYGQPPRHVAPGLRRLADGTFETVDTPQD